LREGVDIDSGSGIIPIMTQRGEKPMDEVTLASAFKAYLREITEGRIPSNCDKRTRLSVQRAFRLGVVLASARGLPIRCYQEPVRDYARRAFRHFWGMLIKLENVADALELEAELIQEHPHEYFPYPDDPEWPGH
jgi:hypothetical protein